MISWNHLEALLIMAGVWLSQLWIFAGFGLRLSRWIGITDLSLRYPLTPIWIGWCAVLFLLQVWQTFLPVTSSAIKLFSVIATILIWLDRRFVIRLFNRFVQSLSLISCLILTLFGGWCACKAMLPPNNWDSGVYHFTSIRWINEYALVPGLANLHGRLAFNQSFFHYVAFLNGIPPYIRGHHFANSFLIMMLLADIILRRSSSRKIGVFARWAASSSASWALVPCIILQISVGRISSPSPDTACIILQFLVFLWILRISCLSKSSAYVGAFLVLGSTMITVKLSNLVFASVPVLWYFFDGKLARKTNASKFVAAYISSLLLGLWAIRSVILSGCLVYPLGVTRIPFDWAASPGQIEGEYELVKLCGRLSPTAADAEIRSDPTRVLKSYDWIRPWASAIWENSWDGVCYPLLIAVGFFCFSVFLLNRSGSLTKLLEHELKNGALVAWTGALLSIAFWFSQAPDPRFIYAINAIFAVSGGLLLSKALPFRSALVEFALQFLVPNAAVLCFLVRGWGYLWVMSISGFYSIPRAELTQQASESGVVVNTPIGTDQCWDAPLPCAPEVTAKLRLRGDDLQSGFTISQSQYQ